MAHKGGASSSSTPAAGSTSDVLAPFDLANCYHVGPYCVDPSWSFGAGGYAKVLRGLDMKSGEIVAVKEFVRKANGHTTATQEYKALERMAQAGGAHPNIIGYRGFGQTPTADYVVMEAATGGDVLKRVMAVGALGEQEARGIFRQMVSGIEHMHRCGVAHRDIKLDNSVFDADGVLRWIDFGLAHVYGDECNSSEQNQQEEEGLRLFCGSRSYMAPEVHDAQSFENPGYDGYRADLWSLGVCLFASTCGWFPIETTSVASRGVPFDAMRRAQASGASAVRAIFHLFRKPCTLSKNLVQLLDDMLQIDPAKRISLAAIGASPWLAGEARLPLPAPIISVRPVPPTISMLPAHATAHAAPAPRNEDASPASARSGRVSDIASTCSTVSGGDEDADDESASSSPSSASSAESDAETRWIDLAQGDAMPTGAPTPTGGRVVRRGRGRAERRHKDRYWNELARIGKASSPCGTPSKSINRPASALARLHVS